MTKEEIIELEHTVKNLSPTRLWIKAFSEYTVKTGERLSMNCSPCYMKVLTYLKNESLSSN